jgi:sulfide dehydrogenase [flavocytochrome c] flavoprotein chain
MKKSQFSPSRRQLLCLAAAAASGAGLVPVLGHADEDERDGSFTLANTGGTTFALANTGLRGNIVVIGGGMAGTTVAKYLRLWGGAGLNVTLVEPNPSYTSNIMSNLVLNNSRTVASLAYGYTPLATKYGITIKQAAVQGINASAKSITLSDGSTLAYDRLVIAPGVEFVNAYGLTQNDYETRVPHA